MTELKPKDFRFVLVTTMKDEAPYILDWLAYHASIGFTHFVILTNDCSDGTDKICRSLSKLGFVTHINNPPPYPKGIQKTAWKRAERWTPIEEAEWVMALDVDEYLQLNIGSGTIEEMLRQLDEKAVAISFPWQIFGNNGVRTIDDIPVPEQFTRAAHPLQAKPYQIRGLKTLFRRRFFKGIGTHMPQGAHIAAIAGRHWVNADGAPIDDNFVEPVWCVWNHGHGFGGTLGRVNHYALRSKDAFFNKFMRGFVNRTSKGVRSENSPLGYWNMFDWNIVEERGILERLPRAEAFKAEMAADPKLVRLHELGLDWHHERAEFLLTSDHIYRETFEQIYEMAPKTSFDPEDPLLNVDKDLPNIFDASQLHEWGSKTLLKPIFVDNYYQTVTKITE